jgi:anaerobic magnesium-protoporphyrin IX monomethyl ester cyclase
MDILLVNPADANPDNPTEHLGLACLHSYITKAGYQTGIIDMALDQLSTAQTVRLINEQKPAMVGVTILHDTRFKGLDLIERLRQSGYTGKVVVGGYFPSFASKELLRDFAPIDYVVRGEGEHTLAELMAWVLKKQGRLEDISGLSYRVEGNIYENPARPLIDDLDTLPFPTRTHAQKIIDQGGHLRIYATRGCWAHCSFCDIVNLYALGKGKAWRRRSADHLLDEIEYLNKTYQTNYFIFNDDQFLVKGAKAMEYVEAFAAGLQQRNLQIKFELMARADTIQKKVVARLKEVGLQRVFLGLESFDKRQLQRFNKRISGRQNIKAVITLYRLKIDVLASVILADAYTGLWDLLQQFMLLFQLRRKYFNSRKCQISINKKMDVYRGTAVYAQYKQAGILTRDDYLQGYDYRLKLLTRWRLGLYDLEERLNRLILRPEWTTQKVQA